MFSETVFQTIFYIGKNRFTGVCLGTKYLDPDPFFLQDTDPDDPKRMNLHAAFDSLT